MIGSFKKAWLEEFFFEGTSHREIPSTLEIALASKLDIIDVATDENDLRVPPGNRFERLKGKLAGKCSIRVNKQYRLIFEWDGEKAHDIYLDSHTYR